MVPPMRLVAGQRRPPGRAVPPLVVQRAIRADDEHVQAVRPPGHHLRLADDGTAHRFLAGDRRTPRRAVPPLVVQLGIGAGDEDVQPVGSPRDHCRRALADAAERLPAGDRWPPGGAVPPLVVEGPIRAQDEDVQPVRAPCRDRAVWSCTRRPCTRSRRATGPQAEPFHHLWYSARSVPTTKTSRRFGAPGRRPSGGPMHTPPIVS